MISSNYSREETIERYINFCRHPRLLRAFYDGLKMSTGWIIEITNSGTTIENEEDANVIKRELETLVDYYYNFDFAGEATCKVRFKKNQVKLIVYKS